MVDIYVEGDIIDTRSGVLGFGAGRRLGCLIRIEHWQAGAEGCVEVRDSAAERLITEKD